MIVLADYDMCVTHFKNQMPLVSVPPWDGMSGVKFNVIGSINLIPSEAVRLQKPIQI